MLGEWGEDRFGSKRARLFLSGTSLPISATEEINGRTGV
jgi:hypothetical protein